MSAGCRCRRDPASSRAQQQDTDPCSRSEVWKEQAASVASVGGQCGGSSERAPGVGGGRGYQVGSWGAPDHHGGRT
eukprot:353468-Chlamydomonas_euryale.AAC.4